MWALHPLKVESTGSPWPELENHEAPEQMRLSTSEYDSVKGRKGLLGSVLEGGCQMGEERWSEMRGETCEQRVEPEQRHGVTPE